MAEEVLAAKKRILGDDAPETLKAMQSLATTLVNMGQHDEGKRWMEDVLAAKRRILGEDSPETLLAMKSLAMTLLWLDMLAARKLLEQTLEKHQQVRARGGQKKWSWRRSPMGGG